MQSFFPAQNTCLLPAAPCAWKIPRPSPQTPAGGTEILKTFPPKHRKFPPPVSPRESPFRKKKRMSRAASASQTSFFHGSSLEKEALLFKQSAD